MLLHFVQSITVGHVRLQKYKYKATIKNPNSTTKQKPPQKAALKKISPNIAYVLWCTRSQEKWSKSRDKQT